MILPQVANAAPVTDGDVTITTPDGTCVRDYIHVDDLAAAPDQQMRRYLQAGQRREPPAPVGGIAHGGVEGAELGSGGVDMRGMHPPGENTVKAGHLVTTELTPCVEGYYAQICRTAVVGKATPTQRKVLDIEVSPDGPRALAGAAAASVAAAIIRLAIIFIACLRF